MISDYGQLAAALIPIEKLEELRRLRDEADIAEADRRNAAPTGEPMTVTIAALPAAPVITSPADGSTVNDSTPTFTGTGGAGDTVTVTDENDNVICSATVDGSGNWTCTAATPIADGEHTFTPTATNAFGSTVGEPVTVTIDTVEPPTAPVITSPADGSTIRCGERPSASSDSARTGRRCTIVFTGTGGPGDTVTITDENDTVVCTAIVDDSGNWTCTATVTRGVHTFTPTATNSEGTTTGDPVTVTVTAPVRPHYPRPHHPYKPYKPNKPHRPHKPHGMTGHSTPQILGRAL
ncbi:Ig-like domain-containing protein [Streptomyces sp. NPDC127084]|uniref:Ig-like domain-containing protein n=1 Tax=Streptomyces sp. NPDC127084 TaxID=3347133 RepID=UPI003668970A